MTDEDRLRMPSHFGVFATYSARCVECRKYVYAAHREYLADILDEDGWTVSEQGLLCPKHSEGDE